MKEHGLEMDHLIRRTRHPEGYAEDLERGQSQLELARSRLGEDETLTWDTLADYAEFLSNLFAAQQSAAFQADTQQNYEAMMEFMATHDSARLSSLGREPGPAREGAELSRESIFRSIAKSRYEASSAARSGDSFRMEIDSFGALQKRVEDQARLGLECLRLAKVAPLETRERVESLLASKSKYLDLRALSRQLARRDFAHRPDPKDFIDKERLLRDIHEGSALKDFMAKYHEVRLDVVSLAEVRSLIDAAKPSAALTGDLIAQIRAVLEHVDEQMRYVSHDRRK